MIQASLEEAYDEACRALGESVVRERLLTKALAARPAAAAEDPDGS